MEDHVHRLCQLLLLMNMLWNISSGCSQSITAPDPWDGQPLLSDKRLPSSRRALLDNGGPIQSNITSEAEILLGFRDSVTSDQNGALVDWNTTLGPNLCTWRGITCDLSGHVSALNLSGQNLVGAISPLLGHLTFLSALDLAGNSFNGTIPPEISNCSSLTQLKLSSNSLEGIIPPDLGRLRKIVEIDLNNNSLTFSIPKSLGNCSSLKILDLRQNHISGTIPGELGRLRRLTSLLLSTNNLTGSIPRSIANCTSLTTLDLGINLLEGAILPELGLLRNLTSLQLEWNSNLTGSIPSSLGNITSLQTLMLGASQLTGRIPPELGRLHSLEDMRIFQTNIGGNIPPELGSMPNLTFLMIAGNNFTGTIPRALGNLTNLLTLFLDGNNFVGEIPSSIFGLPKIGWLSLRNNQLTGHIPTQIANLTNIWRLLFSYNQLTGPLNPELGELVTVQELGLDHNNFTGKIPARLANCQKIEFLYLNHNHLVGSIPDGLIDTFKDLVEVHFDGNQLSGSIPEFGELTSLSIVNLSFNSLSGPIPSSIKNCKALIQVDLSNNNLTGELPVDALQQLMYLKNFSVANNSLQGPIPASVGAFANVTAADYAGNAGLCGALLDKDCPSPVTPHKRSCGGMRCHLYIAFGVAGGFLLAAITFVALIFFRKTSESHIPAITLYTTEMRELRLTMDDLTAATDGFSERNIVGVGGHSTVYKAILHNHDEMAMAVKCLNLDPDEETKISRDLYHELKVLGNLRHRNLVKLYGFCSFSTPPLKALLMEFVPNGSLHTHLHKGKKGCQLNLETRLKIAIEVADAMVYLHHESPEPIIHRDLKPNNILLDFDFNAKVVDFGLAKYIHGEDGEATASCSMYGTTGYIAPEYATSNKVSTRGDVYSYGVVLLEMLTGKRPTDDAFANEGTWLGDWVLQAFPDGIPNILDHMLNREFAARQEQICNLIQVGLLCTRDAAKDRPSMKNVRQMLLQVKDPSMKKAVMSKYPTLTELASMSTLRTSSGYRLALQLTSQS